MYRPRINELEQAFREKPFDDIASLQIRTSWFELPQEKGLEIWSNILSAHCRLDARRSLPAASALHSVVSSTGHPSVPSLG